MSSIKAPIKEYKNNASTLRERRRLLTSEERQKKRDDILSRKRARFDDSLISYTGDQVRAAAFSLEKNKSSRKQTILILRRAFAKDNGLCEEFLDVPNALYCLVGALTSGDPELQLEVMRCLTNMTAGSHHVTETVAKATSPYLITYLSSSSYTLQDYSAWTIGNIAGDGRVCQELLVSQGVITPLIKILESRANNVVYSAAFALCNLTRNNEHIIGQLIERGLISSIKPLLDIDDDRVLTEAVWTLVNVIGMYIMTGEEQLSLINLLAKGLSCCLEGSEPDIVILTGIVRCLGNLFSHTDGFDHRQVPDEFKNVLMSVGSCLNNNTWVEQNIKKELLWMLSNITTDFSALFDENLVGAVIKCAVNSSADIAFESLFCLCNISSQGGFVGELLDSPIVESLTHYIQSVDVKLVTQSLKLLECLLHHGNKRDRIPTMLNGDMGRIIEKLSFHKNMEVQTCASYLCHRYM